MGGAVAGATRSGLPVWVTWLPKTGSSARDATDATSASCSASCWGTGAGGSSASRAVRGNGGRCVGVAIGGSRRQQGGIRAETLGPAAVAAPTGVTGREDEGRFCTIRVPVTVPWPLTFRPPHKGVWSWFRRKRPSFGNSPRAEFECDSSAKFINP